MGRAVLQAQLFDPLRQLNRDLQAANAELARANELKDQFLANMSHELRTPLNAIIGYTELLVDGHYGAISEKQHSRMEKVLRNSRHLLSLINNVLDLSKIEAGQMRKVLEPVDVPGLASGVVDTLLPLATGKGLALTLECEPLTLQADPGQLRQVLINLVGNAIKFTENGQVQIIARQVDGHISIAVQDTGIGIPPEHHAAIFEAFRQVDNSSTRAYAGTGLGLAICKRLIEMHHGQIVLESTPGQGSTFTIRLPLEQPADETTFVPA
ncbi:MAG: HAMP domain-containing histidine kinase [Anaerolineae bacterium]|nr:HAMP domain-containing histidine kinase [Anaerolineae bacterium]